MAENIDSGQSIAHESHFENQFREREIPLFGSSLRTIRIEPERQSEKSQYPVFFAPGFGETFGTNKGPLRMLYEQGREVHSLIHMRFGGNIHEAYESVVQDMNDRLAKGGKSTDAIDSERKAVNARWENLKQHFPKASLRRALTIIGDLNASSLEKVDAIGHSLGCTDIVLAAYLFPDMFNNLVLIESGGLIEDDTRRDISRRSIEQVTKVDPKQTPLPHDPLVYEDTYLFTRYQKDIDKLKQDVSTPRKDMRLLMMNPKRTFEEVTATVDTPIKSLIPDIRKRGIGVAFIHAMDDRIFPMERVQDVDKGVLTRKKEDTLDEKGQVLRAAVDGFLSIGGSHNSLYVEPRIMKAADWLLTKLAEKPKSTP